MNEELLSYYWKLQRFRKENLCTNDGEPVQVIYPGLLNQDAGPDFLHARIRIGDTLWVGNVELHSKSSDWIKHGHQHDPAYANVILHVVYESDELLDVPFPELTLQHFINPMSAELMETWRASMDPIPCHALLKENPETLTTLWMDRLMVERLEDKSQKIESLLREVNTNWEAAFFLWLAHYFGLRVNVLPFEMLARSIPWKLVKKYRNKRDELEALFQGQAGLLQTTVRDGFHRSLVERQRLQRSIYPLEPLDPSQWKFLRMRPANFPSIRISQFADLFFRHESPLDRFLQGNYLEELEGLLVLEAHEYWGTHSRFGQTNKGLSLTLGKDTRQLLLGNAVLPFLFCYAENWSLADKREWVLDSLHRLKPENNSFIRRWNSLGIQANSFADSQSLITLSRAYCEKKRCLSCEVGNQLTRPEKRTGNSDYLNQNPGEYLSKKVNYDKRSGGNYDE